MGQELSIEEYVRKKIIAGNDDRTIINKCIKKYADEGWCTYRFYIIDSLSDPYGLYKYLDVEVLRRYKQNRDTYQSDPYSLALLLRSRRIRRGRNLDLYLGLKDYSYAARVARFVTSDFEDILGLLDSVMYSFKRTIGILLKDLTILPERYKYEREKRMEIRKTFLLGLL